MKLFYYQRPDGIQNFGDRSTSGCGSGCYRAFWMRMAALPLWALARC
ncbi:MAG: hypothetical protein HC925_05880 [Coleofasciculaceae cyanobacterium SM2_3_26]|nr:hypothetical protein [Coleofasciculaceae cyanobacterium SM2_3_26]